MHHPSQYFKRANTHYYLCFAKPRITQTTPRIQRCSVTGQLFSVNGNVLWQQYDWALWSSIVRLVFYVFLITVLATLTSINAFAQTITECPANQLELSKVDFSASNCQETLLQSYKMSNKTAWLSIPFPVAEQLLNNPEPIGIFISGHISTKVFINGVKIGENGVSSLEAETEVAGKFDWVGYVPHKVLDKQVNNIVMHVSSFHADELHFNPFNRLYFDVYQGATNKHLFHYLPTFIPLGAMLLSLIYLIRQKVLDPKSSNVNYLLILTLAATLQLMTEVFRGLFAYTYPIHDLRLWAIWLFAFIFGQALLAQSLEQFTRMKKRYPIAISLGIILLLQLTVSNSDLQTAYCIHIPAVLAACFIAWDRYRQGQNRYTPAIVLLAFALLIIIAPYNFLDVYLYYCIAALLAYLFSYEAQNKIKQQNTLMLETQRAEKLQLALDMQAKENPTRTIALKNSGEIIMLAVENILFCQGAGDYVEVFSADKTILHSGSLSGIITELPNYFIKVHRSYVVNAKNITHMRRLPAGTGEIELSNGQVIPVSRRLLPKLKESLVTE